MSRLHNQEGEVGVSRQPTVPGSTPQHRVGNQFEYPADEAVPQRAEAFTFTIQVCRHSLGGCGKGSNCGGGVQRPGPYIALLATPPVLHRRQLHSPPPQEKGANPPYGTTKLVP